MIRSTGSISATPAMATPTVSHDGVQGSTRTRQSAFSTHDPGRTWLG